MHETSCACCAAPRQAKHGLDLSSRALRCSVAACAAPTTFRYSGRLSTASSHGVRVTTCWWRPRGEGWWVVKVEETGRARVGGGGRGGKMLAAAADNIGRAQRALVEQTELAQLISRPQRDDLACLVPKDLAVELVGDGHLQLTAQHHVEPPRRVARAHEHLRRVAAGSGAVRQWVGCG